MCLLSKVLCSHKVLCFWVPCSYCCCSYCSVSGNGTSLICITALVTNAQTLPVSVFFDSVQRQLDATFEFVDNPTVTSISPLSSFAGWVFTCMITCLALDHIKHIVDCTHYFAVTCYCEAVFSYHRWLSCSIETHRRLTVKASARVTVIKSILTHLKT